MTPVHSPDEPERCSCDEALSLRARIAELETRLKAPRMTDVIRIQELEAQLEEALHGRRP